MGNTSIWVLIFVLILVFLLVINYKGTVPVISAGGSATRGLFAQLQGFYTKGNTLASATAQGG